MPDDAAPRPGDSVPPWRPRSQPPADSYASLRQWRDQAREERARESGPQPVITPPETVTTKQVAAPKRGTATITILALPAPVSAPAEHGPTPQQRLSAIITGIVGLALLVVLVGRPLFDAHASNALLHGGDANAGAAIVPTPTPVYLPMPLDTDHPAPVLWAESAVVMDELNGNILFAKNPDEELPMASTTKLMTALVALSHGQPDQVITINADAANTFCTCVGLKVGEKYTLTELLYGMLMISGNDAAEAIADGLAGNVATFVGWMNQTAVTLGLNHTHYTNPHGLDDTGHYSSARDLAVLARAALSNPLLQQMDDARTYTIPATATHAKHDLQNLHESLWWYPGADGGKPGWTGGARFVDILSAARNGHHLIGVVMHSANDWVTDIRDVLNWGFDDFTWVSPKDIDQQHWIPFDDSYNYFKWDVPSRTLTVNGVEYFPYTGYTLAGAFLTYFHQQGGISTIGFPRGMPLPAANGTLRQHFDLHDIICNPTTGACQKA